MEHSRSGTSRRCDSARAGEPTLGVREPHDRPRATGIALTPVSIVRPFHYLTRGRTVMHPDLDDHATDGTVIATGASAVAGRHGILGEAATQLATWQPYQHLV